MSKKGMIILPVEKDEFQEREERKGNEIRNEMIDAAKDQKRKIYLPL